MGEIWCALLSAFKLPYCCVFSVVNGFSCGLFYQKAYFSKNNFCYIYILKYSNLELANSNISLAKLVQGCFLV